MYRILSVILLTFTFLCKISTSYVNAQDQPSGPIYIVAPGDTINLIADQFGVSVEDIIQTNSITNPNLISAGAEIIIPGLEGISGVLATHVVILGESLNSFSVQNQLSQDTLIRINRITSPSEIYAGSSIIYPYDVNSVLVNGIGVFPQNGTLLEQSVIIGSNPWQLQRINQFSNSFMFQPGLRFFFTQINPEQNYNLISPIFQEVSILPLPLSQGATIEISITSNEVIEITGSLDSHTLHFFSNNENQFVSLQGIHAMREPGLALFQISGLISDGTTFSFEQNLLVEPANFGQDPPLYVDPETIDPLITEPENQLLYNTTATVTNTRFWNGIWRSPTDDPECIRSRYGNRRSYNESDYIYFHTGVDYGVCTVVSLDIFAAAPGIVVFAGPLTVRGNMTVIDHGWGIFSAYYHQSEMFVQVGDQVSQGELIGLIGDTGRVTGPHLHFEVWVNGVQVQPLDWLSGTYPN